jgi:hypothetical protein
VRNRRNTGRRIGARGCTELLVTEALKALAADGFEMATLALAPLAGLPDRDETEMRQTLEHFKGKFNPSHLGKELSLLLHGGFDVDANRQSHSFIPAI